MSKKFKIAVIIPALNEEESIAKVIHDLPQKLYDLDMIVCDNGSTDATAEIARKAGARVVYQPTRGYGNACLKALENLHPETDIVAFIAGDYADDPKQLDRIVSPIIENKADMVLGSRTLEKAEKGALLPLQKFGNRLATFLVRLFWKFHYTDLGPFRAILKSKLDILQMEDKKFAWTIEMQIRALKKKLRILEVPVTTMKGIGKSKISGTVKGSVLAGYSILKAIFKEFFIRT